MIAKWLVTATVVGVMSGLTGCAGHEFGNSTESTVTLLRDADAAYREGQFDQAEAMYRDILDESPGSREARFRLGVIAYTRGDLEQAQARFERVLGADPEHERALHNLAMVHLENARELLDRYEEVAPTDATTPAFLNLRQALDRLASERRGDESS